MVSRPDRRSESKDPTSSRDRLDDTQRWADPVKGRQARDLNTRPISLLAMLVYLLTGLRGSGPEKVA